MATSPSAVDDWIEVPPTQTTDDWIEVPPVSQSAPTATPQAGPRKRNEGAGKPPAGTPTGLPASAAPPIFQEALGVGGEPKSIGGQAVKAVAQTAESLTMDPVNAAITTATGGLGLLAKLPLLKAALPRAISAGFSAQMLDSAYQQSKEFREAINKGDYPKAAHALTTGVLDTVMSALGLRHAAGIGEKATPIRTAEEPSPVEAKVAHRAAVPPPLTGEQYLQSFSKGAPKTAAQESAEVFAAAPTYAELFDQADKLAARRARTKPTIPEEGVDERVSRVQDARERLSRKLTGKPWKEADNSERTSIDELVSEDLGFSAHPAEDWIEVPPEEDIAPATQKGGGPAQPSAEPEAAGAGEVQNVEGKDRGSEQPPEVRPSEGTPAGEVNLPGAEQPGAVRGLPAEGAGAPSGVESQPAAGDKGGSGGAEGVVAESPAKPTDNISAESKAERQATEKSTVDEKPKVEIPRAEGLRPEEREIESRFIEKIQADPEAAIEQYRKDNTGKNGTLVINTDQARELSEDYVKDRTQSRAVHEPASKLANMAYADELSRPALEGLADEVEFTAGGTGAGKTVGSKMLMEASPSRKPPQILFDTNLNNTASAVKKINLALDAGKKVTINYVHRPADLAFEGMLHRAMRMAEESGTGRTVPMATHIETHIGAPKTLLELADIYRDDKRVDINVFDNSGGPKDLKLANPSILRGLEYNGIEGRLNGILDEQLAQGRVSREVYDSIRTPEASGRERGVVREGPEGALGERAPGRPSEALQEPREPGRGTRYGRSTEILIPGSPETYQAVYSVRDLDDVHASHSGQTFQKNPKYEFQNDRDYSDKRNSGRILSQAGDFKPQYLLTDSPDALNGAPIIDSRGNVLGGNSRAMTLDRVYAQKPESAAKYKQQLASQAKSFGIDPSTVVGMRRPVLVRELRGEFTPQKAVTDFNVAGTAALTPAERAVADSHRVSLKTLDEVAKRIEAQGPDGTLAKALSGDGRSLINSLVEDGAVAAQDKPALLNPDGTFSAEGKSRLSRLLIGRLFEDSKQFDTTAPDIRNKLERIVAPLARVEGKGEWDIGPTVKEAIGLTNEAKARDIGIDDLLAQTGMFDQTEYSPAAVAVAKSLGGKATEVAKAFRNYAEEAEMATTGTDAGIEPGLLTAKIPTQLEAFNEAFKSDLTEPIKQPEKKEAAPPVEQSSAPEPKPTASEETPKSKPEPTEHDKSSTQANLPPDLAEKVRAAGKIIPDSELAEEGRETEPHITVLYGTDTNNAADVAKLMQGERPIKAKLGAMSIFPGKDGGPDVVKLDVESSDLRRLNAKIKKALPNTSDFPQYKPHVTIAYVKNGEGAKYAGRVVPGLSGKEVTLDSVHFSPAEGEKTEIPLGAKEPVQVGQAAETKPSKLAQGVEEKAIANKLTAGFEGKPEYETVKVADQAKMAADLIKSDPEKATRIAMGTEPPPDGLLPESVFVAMEDYATKTKDVDLLRDLATTSTLSSEATGMGQRIRMLAERDQNSPVAAIQKVAKAREDAAAKRYGPKAKDNIKKQIRVEIKKANAKPKNWTEWVDSIKCEV